MICFDKFHVCSSGKYSNWPSRQQVKEGMPENLKRTYPSARCIINYIEHFHQKPSSLTVQSKVLFIQAKSIMLQMY